MASIITGDAARVQVFMGQLLPIKLRKMTGNGPSVAHLDPAPNIRTAVRYTLPGRSDIGAARMPASESFRSPRF
jgi:hypothetical protein